jgi:glucokinase
VTASRGALLGIDIGGTKVGAAIVDASGAVRTRSAIPTLHGHGADALFDAVVDLADSIRRDHDGPIAACGVGCGGPMFEGTVSPLNIPDWRDFPLRDRLEERLGVPVAIDNDAKALALAEGWRGAARGARHYLAMVVSTGIGGGLVLDGKLLDGRLGNAGHVGHVIVEPLGRDCVCGARGCLEAEASGTAIAARTGRPSMEASEVERRRAGMMCGRAIASVASLLDLELAVVGGSVALGFGSTFFDAAQRELSARARLSFSASCRVVPVGLADEAPLVGAAAVAMRAMGAVEFAP